MPLLKRRHFTLLDPPTYDPDQKDTKDRQVWYNPITNEVFTDYTTYLQRNALYKQPIWQCETTGRSNLTYKQALDMEKLEKERVQDKLPEELQRRVLQRAQFQTGRMDNIVDDVYNHHLERYTPGEIINCLWDDGVVYNARILDIETTPSDDHKGTNGKAASTEPSDTRYRVQLIDDNNEGLEDFIMTVTKNEIKRDRLAFSKNLLKKYLKESMGKDTYIGAPWIVKPALAEKFGIKTDLPADLQAIKDKVYSKKKKSGGGKAQPDKGIDARRIEASLKYPMEDLDVPVYRRQPSGEGPIVDMAPGRPHHNEPVRNPTGGMPAFPKPTYDHAIPKDCYSTFLMAWAFLSLFARPLDLYPFSLDDFESALLHDSVEPKSQLLIEANVSLLNAIIRERKKFKIQPPGGSSQSKSVFSTHVSSSSSLQAPSSRSSTPLSGSLQREDSSTADSVNGNDEDIQREDMRTSRIETYFHHRNPELMERGVGSAEIVTIGTRWDARLIPAGEDREGWEDVLIGCVNEIVHPEHVLELDQVLNRLVPTVGCTLEDREEAYVALSVQDKIFLMNILIDAVNECSFIKDYMEKCQEQLTELRKQKIDLSRERKRILAERLSFEKKENEENEDNEENGTEEDGTPSADVSEVEADGSDEDEDVTRAQRQAESQSRHESRQAVLKRKQAEREEREAKKLKMYHRQREEARIRSQEQKARNEARKKLDSEELQLHKKEEQVEHGMRKYSTQRVKPLGRDKFFNRYYYFDNIGGANAHGTGRLFVQNPSDLDLILLRERDRAEYFEEQEADQTTQNAKPNPSSTTTPAATTAATTTTTTTTNTTTATTTNQVANNKSSNHANATNSKTATLPPCGHGGGTRFMIELMRGQGLEQESVYVEKRIADEESVGYWGAFETADDLDSLLAWLNPKGVREYRLKREIERHLPSLLAGIKKRHADHNLARVDVPRRSMRSKPSSGAIPHGSWLAYSNRYAK
ncbi:ATP-utilizing chromatin assembly and remodelling N-terminal-domain-containing protein [Syncephalastrum racemosum]|uniref:ATP-utilizing chromatin assembly and remodelling N-terminal-domain-containing protein n=1 Tax=Syncephalastrum racemosum TaxID=13706 RepID=A0A1X2HBP8_SYNRA|nr:ATP-utilizing chromatin assembly and remodelling N-terminal-domain-containing protein [Syncephalastrum racemosum]